MNNDKSTITEHFITLSSAELTRYANPALAKVAFGGQEKGIEVIEFPTQHSLFEFLEKFSAREISAVGLSLFSILLYKYTRQEQFKLRQYRIATQEIYQLDLVCNLTEQSCFIELLESACKILGDEFSYQNNLLDFNQSKNISYSLAYSVERMSNEYVKTLTEKDWVQSEMCLILESDTRAYLAYDRALFERDFIIDLIRHFELLIRNVLNNYDSNLEVLSLTSQTDVTLQCESWRTPASEYNYIPIYRDIEDYAWKFPKSIAITFGDKQVSYGELNSQANRLAHYLLSQNVHPQDSVGVFVDPGTEVIVSILAIHKINAVYVPIDTEYPLGRIKTVLQQVSPSVIICASDRSNEIDKSFETNIINLAAIDLSTFACSNLNYSCLPDSVSHIFFTSGTTGTPKGVVSSHKNLIHYIFTAREKYRFGAEDSFLSATKHSFSISLLMMLMPLVCGGRVNIITLEQLLEPKLLAEAIEGANFFHLGPSILKMLLDFLDRDRHSSDRFNHVKHASSGGDMIPAETLNRLNCVFARAEVYAIYGSSEISCMGCTYFVPKDIELKQTLVGKPFNNVQLRILDRYRRVVPLGVKGEIYFSGQGITLGYLNLPHLTENRYIFLDGERFYRTGDIGRLTPQGNLQMLGRDDNQIQIRGMRIELGEIELSLNLHPGISSCVVIARENRLKEKQLIAYLISQNFSLTSNELRSFLQTTLPQYMIPAQFVYVEEFPLNANGKVDRCALSLLELKLDSQTITQPRNTTEKQLALIWSEIFKIEAIGTRDNFFELGGHSLLATQIISRIREILEVEVSISSLFAFPTIETLAEQIDSTSTKNPVAPILPSPRQEKIPLSLTQKRLWFLYQLEKESSAYNIPLALNIKGVLQVNALKKAINKIICRHETLRTNFQLIDSSPVQLVSPIRDISLEIVDLLSLSESERTVELQRLMEKEIHRPFNLTNEALLRATLFQQTPDSQLLLVTMHHIISDGWSLEIFTSELSAIYTAIVNGQPSRLPELSIQYADYSNWQGEYLQGEILETQINYWRKQLTELPPLLELPIDKIRPAIQTYCGGIERFKLSSELTAKLQIVSKQSGATLFMTLLAAFAILLARYSNSQDIAIGSPIANRNRSELEPLIGFFVNTLVLRTNLEGEPSFVELLQRVKQTALDAYAHQDIQFDKLVEILQPERSLSYNPLFQVMFVLQNGTVKYHQTSALTINPLPVDQIATQFDLSLSMEETTEGLMGFWQYNSDLFEAETIKRLAVHFQILLKGIVENPQQSITRLPLLTQAELQQLLVDWNNTQTEYPRNEYIHQLFEEQAERTPNAVAVVFEGQQLSYQELNAKANQMARYLQKLGVGSKVYVGICVERSLEMIVGLLGILKAGGAYVPLDSKYPKERLELMLSDSQVSVLLTQEKLLTQLPELHAKVIYLDKFWDDISHGDRENLISEAKTDNLAYICYTSGSTGKPKGVCVSHRGVVRLVKETNYVNFNSNEVFLQLAPISFDAATFEIWGSLLNGAKLVIMSPHTPSLKELGQIIQHHQVSTLWLTAGLFHLMVDERIQDLSSVRQLLAGGDVLSVSHVQKVLQELPECKLINGYGPTENTTFTCCYTVTELPNNDNSIPIGKPISNTQIYILDKYLQPLPIGVPGELYIGGDGLARGYLNRPELNSEKFIAHSFTHQSEKLLYKTGDKVRYLPDGNIQFLGRIDNQVKIRGFRIELGEIEAALLQHPSVQKAIVMVNEDLPGDKRLVAYVVANLEQQPSNSELRDFLKQKLPQYMVPLAFIIIESLPLNPNGKVDRRALPKLDASDLQTSKNYIAPRTTQEQQIADIFAKALKLERVSIQDNFFELGGHSLLAVQVFSEIEKTLDITLPLSLLFQQSTVEELAQALQSKEKSSSFSCLVALQPCGSKTPIFGVHAIGTSVQFYRELANHLGMDRPFYGLQSLFLDRASSNLTIEDMAAVYIEEIKKIQLEGPYLLGGFSFGGSVVYEMAQQLLKTGQKVALLALIDAPAPGGYRRLSLQKQTLQHWDNFRNKGIAYAVEKISSQLNFRAFLLKESLKKLAPSKSKKAKQSKFFEARLRQVEAIHKQILNNYQFREYSGKITLFRAATKPNNIGDAWEPTLGWNKFAKGGLEICDLPGDHSSIFQEPNVRIFAEKLNYCIERALSE